MNIYTETVFKAMVIPLNNEFSSFKINVDAFKLTNLSIPVSGINGCDCDSKPCILINVEFNSSWGEDWWI